MIEPKKARASINQRITKRVVDALDAGQTVWDSEIKGFGVRRQTRDPSFVVKFNFGGRQRFYTIGQHGKVTAEGARNEARRVVGLVASGVDPAEKSTVGGPKSEVLTVAGLCERYLAQGAIFKPNKRQSSWDTDRSNITRHIIPLIGSKIAGELTDWDVAKLLSDVRAGKTKQDIRTGPGGRAIVRGGDGAAARCLAVLGSAYNFGIRVKAVATNPVQHVKPPKSNSPGRFLKDEEWQRLGHTLRTMREAGSYVGFVDAIGLLAITGCRKSEITRLRWSEVELAAGFLRLEHSKVGPRSVPLGDEAIVLLEQLQEAATSKWVFPSRRGSGPIVGLQKVWTIVRTSAGLPRVRLHDLRHSFASQAVNSGASLYLTGSVLGHRQAATTQRYAHLQSSPVRAVASEAGRLISAAMKKL